MVGSTSFTYDATGNETGETSSSSGNVFSFAYNAKNQTTSVNSNAYDYTGTTQTERVKDGGTTQDNSPLGLSVETFTGRWSITCGITGATW